MILIMKTSTTETTGVMMTVMIIMDIVIMTIFKWQ